MPLPRARADLIFRRWIPNGTYPEERLVDGAIGAVEDAPKLNLSVGLESSLDFDSSWPIIWPQKTVLYQVDDEHYEVEGTNGFWNSKTLSLSQFHIFFDDFMHQ